LYNDLLRGDPTYFTKYAIIIINTIIKTTSVCDGDATSVGGGYGWPAGDTDGLAGWPVTVGVVSQPGADAERYRCACLHCIQGWLGVVTGISAASTGGVLVIVIIIVIIVIVIVVRSDHKLAIHT